MDWILQHLQLVLAIGGAFVVWLQQRQAKAAAGSSSDEATRPVQPATVAEADDVERARRIREEILRKIAERRGGAIPAAPARPEVTAEEKKYKFPPLMRPTAPVDPFGGPTQTTVFTRPEPMPPPVMVKTESNEAVLARQEKLAQQMRDLEAQRAVVLRRTAAATAATVAAEGVRWRAASSVREDLREPRTLRHAMILREVLGAPVGLR
jgi:hypothetical protein